MDLPKTNLTESQKTCLRLVGRGMSSKEIAGHTGLSPQTVDTYLKTAMARLGASNRREAARLLAALEPSHDLVSQSGAIASGRSDHHSVLAAERRLGGSALVPPIGGALNELDAASRTYAMLRVAALSVVTMIAIALFLAGAFRALR